MPKVEIISFDDKEKGFWVFTAQTQTSSKIENYSWTIREKTPRSTNTPEGNCLESSTINTENTFSKALKKGNYKISCEVVDEDGLSGIEEVEIVVVS